MAQVNNSIWLMRRTHLQLQIPDEKMQHQAEDRLVLTKIKKWSLFLVNLIIMTADVPAMAQCV